MTIRPPPGYPLPELVLVANRVLTEEAGALRSALEDFSNAPRPGCPWKQDDKTVSDHAGPEAQGRAKLLRYTRHQAALIYANAYDHLLTLGRTPRPFQDHDVSPRMVNGRSMERPAHRVASVTSVRPARRCAPIARLRRAAMTLGPDRVLTWDLSS